MDEKEERRKIFEDTMNLCQKEDRLQKAVKASLAGQKLFREEDRVDVAVEPRYEQPAEVIVSKKRSLEAAAGYPGKKVCVLNFASATNPGGGVVKGAGAQEECICRCSTLYPCINDDTIRHNFHGIHRSMLRSGKLDATYNDDCIFTPGVMVVKSDTRLPKRLPKEQWYAVDIITCAAPNLRERPSNSMNPGSGSKKVNLSSKELQALHKKRLERILAIAKANKEEVVILGAFGCGAFQNPPEVVAKGMREAVEEYRNDFETVEFAVFCRPRDDSNYKAFEKAMREI